MPPVVAVITAIASTIGAALTAIGGFTVLGINVGRLLLQVGLNLAISALFAPKKASVADRQGSILELRLGETPRMAIYGRVATGGALMNAWNDGPDNDYETVLIRLADHECDAIEGFILGDKYYPLTAPGPVDHADFKDNNGNIELVIEWKLGAPGTDNVCQIIKDHGINDAAPNSYPEFSATDTFAGLTYAAVRYHVSPQAWKSGRPTGFRFVVRGYKCYDPRLDDTVEGGAGPHRWADPSTREWSDNAYICRANFIWGAWNYSAVGDPELMVGPGKSFEEEPAESVIAPANVCDEAVTLKAGGTEPRYRASGVVFANEPWINIEEHFAQAMGGQLVERGGTISCDVGAAKTPVGSFTDKQLLRDVEMSYQAKIGRDKLVNTVVAKYVDPALFYQENSAPIRRSLADITADGEPREQSIDLVFVTSGTQAQRVAEIVRRKARIMPAAVVALGPAYMPVEDGDWLEWTSDRRFAGATRTFEVQGVNHDEQGRVRLPLKQIAATVFAWNPAVDELDPNTPEYVAPGGLLDAQLDGFAAEAIVITNNTGSQRPAIRATWTPPTDVSITAVLIEWRKSDEPGTISTRTTTNVSAGEAIVGENLVGGAEYEIRITPVPTPTRPAVVEDWIAVDLDDASSGYTLSFTPIYTANMRIVGSSLRKVEDAAGHLLEWDESSSGSDPVEWDESVAGSDPITFSEGWDGEVYSAEGYTNGAVALAIAVDTDKAVIFGLSQLPATTTHFDDIDFGWYLGADGKRRIYESGALVWDNSGAPESYAANDVFSVVYDGSFVRYYVSGVLKYERAADPGLILFFDATFKTIGARIDGVSFSTSQTSGTVVETRYRRSVAPPATPTGAEPEGWTLYIPTGTDALWASSVPKTLSGVLLDVWSTPALISNLNPRGVYSPSTTYYLEDVVSYGGSYRCIVSSTVGNAPSGTAQDNAYWQCIAPPGEAGTPATPPSGYTRTIDLASTAIGANLYTLAVADGYSGSGDTTITFEVESGVSVAGLAGAPNGGIAIDTGTWPSGYTHAITLRVKSGGIVRGGGGKGGDGGDSGSGVGGGNGGDAINCRLPITIQIDSGAIVQGGGGGGGGGRARKNGGTTYFPRYDGGGGGGGGKPNGPGGAGGNGTNHDGDPGTAATTSAVGVGGASVNGDDGANGGDYGSAGVDNAPGAGGYCIRKNGNTVTVTNSGTTAGLIG